MLTALLIIVGSLCLIIEAFNLFMLWWVPRRTRAAMNDLLASIDQSAIDAFVKQMSTQIIPEALKRIDWDTISLKMADSMKGAVLGTVSGDKRSQRLLEQAMTEDMLSKSTFGGILELFPAVKKMAIKRPGVARLFMTKVAPGLSVNANAQALLGHEPDKGQSINVPNASSIPPNLDKEKLRKAAEDLQERIKKGEFNV